MKNFLTKNFIAKKFDTRNIKLFLLIAISIFSSSKILSMSSQEQIQENDWHFNTKSISNTKETRQKLIDQDGFIEIEIPIIQENNTAIPEELLKQEATGRYDAFLADLNTAINNPQSTPEEKAQAQQMLNQINIMPKDVAIQTIINQIKGENANTKIKCLFLARENARATIIFTPGFYPGNKENFAPFVKIAPKDCNLLFLELSGNGENGGTIKRLWNANKFGLKEHFEIIEAIKYVNQIKSETPIVLFGWCSGAFTATRALIELRGDSIAGSDQDKIKQLNIKGLIFDSGFGSIKDILPNVTDYLIKEKLKFLAPSVANSSVNNAQNTALQANGQAGASNSNSCCGCGLPSFFAPITTFLQPATSWISGLFDPIKPILDWIMDQFKSGTTGTVKLLIDTTISSIIKPSIVAKDGETNINDKIKKIADIQTFFIHSKDDLFTPIAGAERLYNIVKTENPSNDNFWAGEGYHHATMNLNFKHEYKSKLAQWLTNIIGAEKQEAINPQNPTVQNPQTNTGNNKKSSKKLHIDIQEMIEIIDHSIKLIETQKQILQSQKPEAEKLKEKQAIDQELNKLFQAFFELLNKTSAIPEKSKAKIMGKLEELNKATTIDGQITILKEIKDILLNITPEKNNKTGVGKGQQNIGPDSQNDKNMHNYNPGHSYSPDNNNINPQQQNVPDSQSTNTNNNSPSNLGHNNYPSSSGNSSGSGYRNPGSGSSGKSGSKQPSYYPSSGNSSGFGGSDWSSGSSSGNQNDKLEEKPNLTQGEYEYLMDEDYDQDPQMKDHPDRRSWFPQNRINI